MQNIQIPPAFEEEHDGMKITVYIILYNPFQYVGLMLGGIGIDYHTFGVSSLVVVTSMHKLVLVALQE